MEMLVMLIFGFTWGVLLTLVFIKFQDMVKEMRDILEEERALFDKKNNTESTPSENT